MIYKNIKIHNAAELIDIVDGVAWKRLPSNVCNSLEIDSKQTICTDATGVELRFVLMGDEVKLRMASLDLPEDGVGCTFHVYYGGIQGGWSDHEVHRIIENEPKVFVIKKPQNIEKLKRISEECGYDWDPEVIRIIFDRGHIKLLDVMGDIKPPKPNQMPKRTMLNYGSSITHGSNSIDMSHSWSYMVAHNLNVDCINLGMAGSCAMEPCVIDYIAVQGELGNWDFATLELGINVLAWEESKIYERVTYAIEQIALRNPEKPVVVISPFYCNDDFDNGSNAEKWRRIIEEVVNTLNLKNVYYKSGLYFIDNISYISADEVHPNIYGVQRIADKLTDYIKNIN